MAEMWRTLFRSFVYALLTVILSGGIWLISESTAQAGFLKNGVRSNGKRIETIRPPRSGSRNRLRTLEERQRQPAGQPSAGRTSAKQKLGWFWKAYSPGIGARSSERWAKGLQTLSERRAKGKGIVASETVAAIDLAYRNVIAGAARRHNLSEALLVAVITVESRGKPQARSHKGAQGLMQLIPATAKRFGVKDAYQPAQNIAGGAAYLDWLLREFDGDVFLALAGYNAGEGAVRKHKGVPPYAETRDYVVKVLDAAAAAASLCQAPLISPRTRCKRRASSPTG